LIFNKQQSMPMKWLENIVIVIFSVSSAFITGCHRGLVATTPVPPQQEGVEIYPSRKHIWVSGKHRFNNGGKSIFRRGRFRPKSNDTPRAIIVHRKRTSNGPLWVPGKSKKSLKPG
jgi:hypothetical protein